MHRIILLIGIIALGTLTPRAVLAYEKTQIDVPAQNDFIVEPGKTEIFLNPGESVVKNVTITSRIDRPVRFRLTTEDLVGSDDPTQTVILLGEETGPYSLKDFIQPEISEFTLSLGERITIPVTISVPQNAEPRGYYGSLLVANDPAVSADGQTTDAQGKTRIISRIGSLFLVKVNGEGVEAGTLKDFKLIEPKAIYKKRPSGFEVAYENTGTVHLVPYGTITIKNGLGRIVARLPVDAYFVLPDSVRYRQIMWQEGFGIGRYTATLSLHKGYGEEVQSAKISFWILPLHIIIGVLVSVIVIVAILYYLSVRFEIKRKK